MRARARREKFLHSLRAEGENIAGDRFDSVRALFAAGNPLVWKLVHGRRKAFLGSILIIKATGELTPEGRFLETQGWTKPKDGRATEEERIVKERNGS